MRFVYSSNISRTDFGYDISLMLQDDWKNAGSRFMEAIKNCNEKKLPMPLQSQLDLANFFLSTISQTADLSFGEFGLHHINITPYRAGLDLLPDQDSYMGHNISHSMQLLAIHTIIWQYFSDLDLLFQK